MSLLSLMVGAAHAEEAPASTPESAYTIAPGGLQITEAGATRTLPLPDCEPRAIAREGERVYVACGASGLLVLEAADPGNPVIAGHVPTDGDAVALHVVSGKVWVELARLEARPAASLLRGATHPGAGFTAVPVSPEGGHADDASPGRRSLAAPARHGALWELQLGTRAFLPIGNIGFGLLGGGSASYRFDAPVAIYGELSPLGIAGGKQGTIGSAGGYGILAFDTQLFELGLGLGAATLGKQQSDATSSLSFAQLARVGARDGHALFVRSNIVVVNDEFAIGSIAVTGQLTLAQRWWLQIAGGGGPIGFAYGDLGVRYLVQGDLGPGSFFVTGTVGGAGIFKSTPYTMTSGNYVSGKSADYAGPALGIAVELRL